MPFEAIVKSTKEPLKVYKLASGNYYDYDRMGSHEPPSAIKAGKKEFTPDELIIGKELK